MATPYISLSIFPSHSNIVPIGLRITSFLFHDDDLCVEKSEMSLVALTTTKIKCMMELFFHKQPGSLFFLFINIFFNYYYFTHEVSFFISTTATKSTKNLIG